MRKIGALVATLMAMCLAGPAQALPTDTQIAGTLSKAENTCVSPIEFFQFTFFQLCSYSGGVDIQSVVTSAPSLDFHNWMGPQDSGGFYPKNFLLNPRTNGGFAGSTPGDGKINLPFTGTITIEDSQTPGNGADDKISGTLIFGPGERAAVSSNGNAVERFDGITHTIPATTVSSATGNALGGFDYVIGSQGFPVLISTALDDYPSEKASIATDDPVPPNFNAWDVASGGNITLPPYAAPPVGGFVPHSVEIVTYAPGAAGNSNVEPNIGLKTSVVTTNLTCESGDADSTPDMTNPDPPDQPELIDDCNPDPAIGAGSTWAVSGAEFDNLILKLSTDANFKVVSAEAFYTLEYKIESLNLNAGKPGSYVGGRLSLVSLAEAVDDSATTTAGTAVIGGIDILANDIGFDDPVTITLGAVTAGATVTITGTNPGPQAGISVAYTPPASFSGQDTFNYTVDDNIRTDTATVTVTVLGSGGGSSFPIAPDAGLNTGEGQALVIDVPLLPGASLGVTPVIVTVVGPPGSGTTVVAGQRITYTPKSFPDKDNFDYMITSADGQTSTGTIFVNIGPSLEPTAVDDPAVMTVQGSSVNIDVRANDSAGSGAIANHTITILKKFIVVPDDPEDPDDGRAAVSGDAVVEADGTVTYTPDPGTSGIQTFQYTLTDTGGPLGPDTSVPATVTVTIEKAAPGVVPSPDGEPVAPKLPAGSSSAIAPWSLVFLAAIGWLRRRRNDITGWSWR